MTVRCVLAHDLINSITAIIALSELLNDDTAEPRVRQRAHDIRRLADRMATAVLTHQCAACAAPVARPAEDTATVLL